MRKPRLSGTIGCILVFASAVLAQVPPGLCSLSWRGDAAVDYEVGVETPWHDVASRAQFTFKALCSGGGGNNQCLNNCCCFTWMKYDPATHSWDEARQVWYNGGPYSCGGTYSFTDSFWDIAESYGDGSWQVLCVVFTGSKAAPGTPRTGWQRFFTVD